MSKYGVSYETLGKNLRLIRTLMGYSLRDLAREAKVSKTTLLHAEQGIHVHERNLAKIMAVLRVDPKRLKIEERPMLDETAACPYVVHAGDQLRWHVSDDHRRLVPHDNQEMIQEERERLRLGRFGFVNLFMATPNFIMPTGPGSVLLELHGPWKNCFNRKFYRYGILHVIRGKVLVGVGEAEPQLLGPASFIGFPTHQTLSLQPAMPIAEEGPAPQLLWVGAERKGKIPSPVSLDLLRSNEEE